MHEQSQLVPEPNVPEPVAPRHGDAPVGTRLEGAEHDRCGAGL
jgi:hypothetical protein